MLFSLNLFKKFQSKNITGASFLKYLGMAGTGVIGTIMVNSLFNKQNNSPNSISQTTPKPTPEPTPEVTPTSNSDNIDCQTFSFETVQVDSYGQITTTETKTARFLGINYD